MNRNYRVITIHGVRGVLAIIFVVLGLIAGFIISPAWVCMKFWNKYIAESGIVSSMNLFQGILLWAIIALSLYALNNNKSIIGFGSYPGLTPDQIRNILNRTKEADLKKRKEFQFKNLEIKKELETEQVKTEEQQNEKEEIGS